MTQPPSPSAAALEEALSALMLDIEQAVQDQFDEARKDFADEIYPADIIEGIHETLRNTNTIANIAAQAVAAERAKPAASDLELLYHFCAAEPEYPQAIAIVSESAALAALAERGARERDYIAKAAEDDANDHIAAWVRGLPPSAAKP